MARVFEPVDGLSSWRRLAPHVWDRPHDPTVYGVIDVVVERTLPYLEELSKQSGTKIRLSHLVTKALALAIRATPEGNAIVSQRSLKARRDVDVFVQVSLDGGRDLSGAKIMRADEMSLVDIAKQLAERAERVRQRADPGVERTKNMVDRLPNFLLGWSVRVMEYLLYDLQLDLSRFGIASDQFGSAMVSNIGTFDGFGMNFALAPLVPISRVPIVVLVGEVQRKPVVEDDRVVVKSVVTLGCTFDHRVLDGSKAIKIAARLREVAEDPESALGPVPVERHAAAG